MQRTNTTGHTRFELPTPNAAAFDFDDNTLTITVPVSSKWHRSSHLHYEQLDAQSIMCTIEGRLRKSYVDYNTLSNCDISSGPGWTYRCNPNERASWASARGNAESGNKTQLTVQVVSNNALFRNLCSAVLDSDLYARLKTTPSWIKALFGLVTRISPSIKEYLLQLMLRVQLQVMYYDHDYHINHGSINFTWPWHLLPGNGPPDWARLLKQRSVVWVSRVVMYACFWTGRHCWKGQYFEYGR